MVQKLKSSSGEKISSTKWDVPIADPLGHDKKYETEASFRSIEEFILGVGFGEKKRSVHLPSILRVIRAHLGMDVAFISEFKEGRRYFKYVDQDDNGESLIPGTSDPLEDTYCQRIVDGRLPELIPDTSVVPAARVLAATVAGLVGSHLSIPIKRRNGEVFGTFCCFSSAPHHSLNERDHRLIRAFSQIVAEQIEDNLVAQDLRLAMEDRVGSLMAGNGLTMAYQPIYQITDSKVVGFEALARFSDPPLQGPDVWFREAGQVGLGVLLEIRAIELALQGMGQLPGNIYVSMNASPETVLEGGLGELFHAMPLERIVLEVTEREAVEAYEPLKSAIAPLRNRGLRLAIDDAGAGYASFRHILNLAPEIIKFDISITRNIDNDRSRQALVTALVGFAKTTGCEIVSEGVETAAELAALCRLGVNHAQGYFLDRPMPIKRAMVLADRLS